MICDPLENSGWKVERVEFERWWLNELWRVTSVWRPNGMTVFVGFLADGQIDDVSDPKHIWAVWISRKQPSQRLQEEGEIIRLRPRWPERLKEIVDAVAVYRSE